MKKITIDKIKVSIKFPANPESSVKAVAIVTLGPIKIKGFKIQDSDYLNRYGDAIWITPPANRGSDGHFYDTIYIPYSYLLFNDTRTIKLSVTIV